MRWRDLLLLGPVALVAVMAGAMALDLPPAAIWLISAVSAAFIAAYLALERLRPRQPSAGSGQERPRARRTRGK